MVTLSSGEIYFKEGIVDIYHLYDMTYPHKCFKCGKRLRFYEVLTANIISEKELLELWKSRFVQFYCCICYGREV